LVLLLVWHRPVGVRVEATLEVRLQAVSWDARVKWLPVFWVLENRKAKVGCLPNPF